MLGKDFELAICEWPSRDGEKPAPAGHRDGEIGMGVSGRGGDCLQRRHIGSRQDDPGSVQPREVERVGDDRADDGGGDRYRRAELAVALAGNLGDSRTHLRPLGVFGQEWEEVTGDLPEDADDEPGRKVSGRVVEFGGELHSHLSGPGDEGGSDAHAQGA
jgi:hypothetical protein